MMSRVYCYNCGASYDWQQQDKLKICDYCQSSIFRENDFQCDDSLIQLNRAFYLDQQKYVPISVRFFQYEAGRLAEWQVLNELGQIWILTQEDECCSLVQETTDLNILELDWHRLMPNTQLLVNDKKWLVTEQKVLHDQHLSLRYAYLTGRQAQLLVIIFTENKIVYRLGYWFDPFDIGLMHG